MRPYLKAIVATLIAGLGATKLALGDNSISGQEAVEVAIVTLTALGAVWATPNRP